MLKTLCMLNGTSGREQAVRAFLTAQLPADASYRVDALGNLIVEKRGANRPKNKVMLAAHMDEVGFIITYITKDGYLKFAPVGGIDERVIFGRAVTVGEHSVAGVIGGKAVHQLTGEEKELLPKCDDMYIDIGAASAEQAAQLVSVGDCAYFKSEYREFGNGMIKAKAIDDRAGCKMLLDMIKEDLPFDMTFCFTVQEEIGTRGAAAAAVQIQPDYAIVLESTTAADISDVPAHKQVCRVGGGAVVSFMDKGTVYDNGLYTLAFRLAKEHELACQTKTVIAGGNDAAAIHKAAGGIKTIAVSVPCRYIHSGACVAALADIECTAALAALLAKELCIC